MSREPKTARQPLLEIARYHRSENEAREYVKGLAEAMGVVNFGTKLASGKDISLATNAKPILVNLRNEVFQARLHGVPSGLQTLFDQSDRFMPPAFAMGMTGNVPGISIGLTVTIGSFSRTLQAPGVHEPPVGALANDVLFFRRQVVEESSEPSLDGLARSYRTYLQVCISLVDAFIGQATFAIGERQPALKGSEHFHTLQSAAPFATRIDAWFLLFGQTSQQYRQTKCWSDLDAIRQERNRYVHPTEPLYSIGIGEIVNVLNRCRDGIGGSLEAFRAVAGLDSRMSYIQKVKTAPTIKKCSSDPSLTR